MTSPKPGTPGYKPAYYAYDVESGSGRNGRSAVSGAGRWCSRRMKWIVIVATVVTGVLYLSAPPPPRPRGEGHNADQHGPGAGLDDIWHGGGDGDEEPKGWGWGFGLPLPFGGSGSKLGSGSESGIDGDIAKGEAEKEGYIAPMHPNLALLPSPHDLFPEVKLPSSLALPNYERFPDSRLREIISDTDPLPIIPPHQYGDDAFISTWNRPEEWNMPRGEVRRVQWSGFAGGRDRWESQKEMEVRLERKEAVKRGSVWAWQGYKSHAWGESGVKAVGSGAEVIRA